MLATYTSKIIKTTDLGMKIPTGYSDFGIHVADKRKEMPATLVVKAMSMILVRKAYN